MVRLHFLIRHRLPWVAGCLAHGIGYEGLLGLDLSIFWSVLTTFRYLLPVASQFNQSADELDAGNPAKSSGLSENAEGEHRRRATA